MATYDLLIYVLGRNLKSVLVLTSYILMILYFTWQRPFYSPKLFLFGFILRPSVQSFQVSGVTRTYLMWTWV